MILPPFCPNTIKPRGSHAAALPVGRGDIHPSVRHVSRGGPDD
jgi:hypothetical protein